MKMTNKQVQLLDESVQHLNLPIRVINALEEKKGVYRIRQLLQLTREEILDIENFGKKTLQVILDQLAEHGFVVEGSGPTKKEQQRINTERRKRVQEYYTSKGGDIAGTKKKT